MDFTNKPCRPLVDSLQVFIQVSPIFPTDARVSALISLGYIMQQTPQPLHALQSLGT